MIKPIIPMNSLTICDATLKLDTGLPRIVFDIGGTLIKVIYCDAGDESDEQGFVVYKLAMVSNENIDDFANFLLPLIKKKNISSIPATGLGCAKNLQLLEKKLSVSIILLDEFACHDIGLRYIINEMQPSEAFFPEVKEIDPRVDSTACALKTMLETFKSPTSVRIKNSVESQLINCNEVENLSQLNISESNNNEKKQPSLVNTPLSNFIGDETASTLDYAERRPAFPCLLAVWGSALQIWKVTEDNIDFLSGGSGLGGKTFLGLAAGLTGENNFDVIMSMAQKGKPEAVHIMGADIYINGKPPSGVYQFTPKDFPVYMFGKVQDNKTAAKEDVLAGLLDMMIFNTIGIILSKLEIIQGTNVFFAGNFTKHESVRLRINAHFDLINGIFAATNGRTIKAIFMKHGGHLCALGALLNGQTGKLF